MQIRTLALILLVVLVPALAEATPSLKTVAPGLVVDSHCPRELYPHFWQALLELKKRSAQVEINLDLALADVFPSRENSQNPYSAEAQTRFLDHCVLALLREHLRTPLDQALIQIVERVNLRQTNSDPVNPPQEIKSLVQNQ